MDDKNTTPAPKAKQPEAPKDNTAELQARIAELEAKLAAPIYAGDTPEIMADAKTRFVACGGALTMEQALQAARAQHNENLRAAKEAKDKAAALEAKAANANKTAKA